VADTIPGTLYYLTQDTGAGTVHRLRGIEWTTTVTGAELVRRRYLL
jgi:hypothetical protein